jgi:hypothetical protein
MPPLFILKPIFWNTNSYHGPSGAKATGGFPKEKGYGLEEWNNSEHLVFERVGEVFRTFYIASVGNAPVLENAGNIFVFMIAAHDGVQELVGIAGMATCLDPEARNELVLALELEKLGHEAWSQERVRECHQNNEEVFWRDWQHDVQWLPSWECPVDFFFWPRKPARLDPRAIAGKQRLVAMYGAHQLIEEYQAIKIIESVPIDERNAAWINISSVFSTTSIIYKDIIAIENDSTIHDETTRLALIQARLGQGRFRDDLFHRWNAACAVTGCELGDILRASHIKPWRICDNNERLNPGNGLLLIANIDALFDSGLISFTDNGDMLVSDEVSDVERRRLGIPLRLRRPPDEWEKFFLHFHRNRLFGRSAFL